MPPKRLGKCLSYTGIISSVISCIILITIISYTTYNWEFYSTLIQDIRSAITEINLVIPTFKATLTKLRDMYTLENITEECLEQVNSEVVNKINKRIVRYLQP